MNDFNFYDSANAKPRQDISRYTAKTFMWMFIGLMASFVAAIAVNYFPPLFYMIYGSGFGIWGLLIAEVVLVFVISLGLGRMKPGTATMLFFIYSIVNGLTLSSIFLAYDISSVIFSFVTTALIFGARALFGYITKKDLTKLGTICMFALIGCVVYSLIAMLFGMGISNILYSCIVIIVFMGLTAFDVQKIKKFYYGFEGDEDMLHKCAIISALQLYLDFINIFLSVLRLSGRRSN